MRDWKINLGKHFGRIVCERKKKDGVVIEVRDGTKVLLEMRDERDFVYRYQYIVI